MRVSFVGLLRNSANELRAQARTIKRLNDPDDEAERQDWSDFYAFGLEEAAKHLDELDADPTLLREWADLYAMKGLVASIPAPSEKEG